MRLHRPRHYKSVKGTFRRVEILIVRPEGLTHSHSDGPDLSGSRRQEAGGREGLRARGLRRRALWISTASFLPCLLPPASCLLLPASCFLLLNHPNLDLRLHVRMQPDRHAIDAKRLDRLMQVDLALLDLVAERLELLHDVTRGD